MTVNLEPGLPWRRSSACADSNCVEVAGAGQFLYLRDSKEPGVPALRFTRAEWEAFLAGVKAGEFDSM